MSWLSAERYAAELAAETARLGAAVTRQAPEAAVPDCPDWTMRDLVTHVGTGHRLATGIITERRPKPYQLVDAPAEQAEWAGWLDAGAHGLTEAVRRHGFDEPVWTWQPKHQTAGFWLRRMLHDLIVHRFDATPGDGGDLAADLAADGVDDMLLVLATISKLTGSGETLLFAATDTPDRWHVTLTPDAITWRHGEAPADVTVAAPVTTLLLTLNRRRDPATVTGDRPLFDRWREASRF